MDHSKFIDRQTIRLRVNGQEVEREVEVRKLLADFLREDLGLTATHRRSTMGVDAAPGLVTTLGRFDLAADAPASLPVDGRSTLRGRPAT